MSMLKKYRGDVSIWTYPLPPISPLALVTILGYPPHPLSPGDVLFLKDPFQVLDGKRLLVSCV